MINISAVLDTSLTVLAVASGLATKLGIDASKLKYLNAITTAVSAAESAIDKVAYTDQGTINVARENLAILILSKILPKFDDAQARADINTVLAVIHAHATANANSGSTNLTQNVSQLVADIKTTSPLNTATLNTVSSIVSNTSKTSSVSGFPNIAKELAAFGEDVKKGITGVESGVVSTEQAVQKAVVAIVKKPRKKTVVKPATTSPAKPKGNSKS